MPTTTAKKGATGRPKAVPSPLKYPGGKHYFAPQVISRLPPRNHYDTFVDAMAGSAAYLLAHDPAGKAEVVNDLDQSLTTFWRVLQSEDLFGRLSRLLQNTPFSADEFAAGKDFVGVMEGFRRAGCREAPTADEQVLLAAAYFVRCRQSMMGVGRSFAPLTTARLRRGVNEQASAWMAAVDGLEAVHRRLRPVVILNEDVLGLLGRLDRPRVCFVLDPPYVPESRVSKKLYPHEFTAEQHRALLDILLSLKHAYVCLNGYDSDAYRDALEPKGWRRHEVAVPSSMSVTGGGAKPRRLEVVWTNYGADGARVPPAFEGNS